MTTEPDLIGELPNQADETVRAEIDPGRLLTFAEMRFVECVLAGNTQATAYRLAYPNYDGPSAHVLGSAIANKPHVKVALGKSLDLRREQASQHATKNVGRILDEYLRIAFFDAAKLFDNTGRPKAIGELDDDTRAAIVGLEVVDEFEGRGADRQQTGTIKKYKIADKQKALDSLAKVLGILVEKTELTGKDGKDLIPAEVSPNELARRIAFVLLNAKREGESQ